MFGKLSGCIGWLRFLLALTLLSQRQDMCGVQNSCYILDWEHVGIPLEEKGGQSGIIIS